MINFIYIGSYQINNEYIDWIPAFAGMTGD